MPRLPHNRRSVVEAYQGKGPHDLVRSMNLYRRHLDKSQMAMVAAALLEPYEKEAKKEQDKTSKDAPRNEKGHVQPVVANLPSPVKPKNATDKAAADFGISGRSVRDAKVVTEEGTPDRKPCIHAALEKRITKFKG